MADDQAPSRKRLYLVSGVMQRGNHADVLPGVVLAESECEASDSHVKWMHEHQPGYYMHSAWAAVIPDDLVRQAAKNIPDE